MVGEVVRATGRVDILVNNAAGNFICRAEDLSPNGWNAVIGIVLNGGFLFSRAVEWARHKIRVNAIAPGPIESPGAARQLWSSDAAVDAITAGVPLGRWGRADESADSLAFLLS